MHDLTYFNLGFRSENIAIQFESKKSKISKKHVTEAQSILLECLTVESIDSTVKYIAGSRHGYNPLNITPILFEVFKTKSMLTIMKNLNKLNDDLKLLAIKEPISSEGIEELTKFFKAVADASIMYSSHLAQTAAFEGFRNAQLLS
ncbi:MAG: hypothetical protein IID14_03640 [Candidatus Marinimicrobia bacterium]|nr:hypothetical protein [Candidatus Neomarinimicrobiota bacterium]